MFPPHARLAADRGQSPNSEGSFPNSEETRRDKFPEAGYHSETDLASDGNHDISGKATVDGADDLSDIEASSAPEEDTASISFGALAHAQAALLADTDFKSHKRISSIAVARKSPPSPNPKNPSTRDTGHKGRRQENKQPTRHSKHAPTEISSKKAVSRKRPVVPVPKRDIRDPRFENALGPINLQKIKSNYAFLEEYREHEMKSLKAEMKKSKSNETKEQLRREISQRESRKREENRKAAEQDIKRRHRKEERAKIESGKAPFYLKRAQVKTEALLERYGNMKAKQVDKVIERRRKKRASRDKRHTPEERRVGEM